MSEESFSQFFNAKYKELLRKGVDDENFKIAVITNPEQRD